MHKPGVCTPPSVQAPSSPHGPRFSPRHDRNASTITNGPVFAPFQWPLVRLGKTGPTEEDPVRLSSIRRCHPNPIQNLRAEASWSSYWEISDPCSGVSIIWVFGQTCKGHLRPYPQIMPHPSPRPPPTTKHSPYRNRTRQHGPRQPPLRQIGLHEGGLSHFRPQVSTSPRENGVQFIEKPPRSSGSAYRRDEVCQD